MLYWFRTPPGVRVGRAALDEDAIRLIEEHNPEIAFNWTQILRSGSEAPSEPVATSNGRQPSRQQKPLRPVQMPAPGQRESVDVAPEVAEPESLPAMKNPPEATELTVEPLSLSATLDEYDATLAGGEPVPAGGIDDFERREAPPPAASARLGSEGLLRLRARYAEILARISDRVSDPVRQEELKAQAERLNPDTWVTDREVQEGLEQYEAVFESLRAVIGRKRTRRRRRRGGHASSAPPADSSTVTAGDSVPPADVEGDDDLEGPEGGTDDH